MAGNAVGASAVERRSGWFRPAAWPDGRLFNANEDQTTRVALWVVFVLLAVHSWLLGRSDAFEVAVSYSSWILSGGLLVASALCILVARKRIWARASSSGAGSGCGRDEGGAAGAGAGGRTPLEWVRAPRWPDGRRFAVRDRVATAATMAAVFAACAAVWLLGEAGIPRIDVSAHQGLLLPVLQLAMVAALWVMIVRAQVVQAVVEGWADDDSELGFVQVRVAAVAANAKRARARFAPSSV